MVKNILMALWSCTIIYMPARAQLQKGSTYVGATVGLFGNNKTWGSGRQLEDGINQFSISPSLLGGKFVKDNMLLGMGIGTRISGWTQWQETNGGKERYKNTANTYYLSPFVRNYKTIGSRGKWAVFLTSSAELAFLHSKMSDPNLDNVENGFSVGLKIKPGIAYWINPRFSLESDINLLSLEGRYSSLADSKSFYFSSGATSNLDGYFSVRASWYIQKH